MPPVAVGTRLSLAQVISSDPVTVRPNGSAVEMDVHANFAGTLTIGQQVLTGFDESGRLVVFAQTTNPDYIPNTAGAIESYNIADAAITREHILADAIDRTRIAQGEVTAALIAIDAINETHISPEAITAPAIAANSIVGYHVVANTISASHIAAFSITAQEIAAQSIVASRILAGTITADRIATGTITATQIAANTITSTQIQTGTIQASDIATGTLTSASGVFGTISANHITTGSLSADRISAGTLSVGTIILNGAVLSSGNYNGNFDGGAGWSMNGTNAVFNNVTVRGTLSGVTGTFAGSLSAATGTFAGAITGGTITIGAGNNAFRADSNGIYLGNATFASAPFRVTPAGAVTASNISITGGFMTGGSINIGSGAFVVSAGGQLTLGIDTQVNWAGSSVYVLATSVNRLHLFTPGELRLQGGSVNLIGATNISGEISGGAQSVIFGGNNCGFSVGNIGAPGASRIRVDCARDLEAAMVVINRENTPGLGAPKGIDIYLGAVGSTNNPQDNDDFIRFRRGDGTVVGQIDGDGAGGTRYHPSSDRKLKTNITDDLTAAADAFDQIPWRVFDWESTGQTAAGVVAQELYEVPRWRYAVSVGGDFEDESVVTGEREMFYKNWGVDYLPFIGAIGAKVKQLEARIRELETA